MFIVRPAITASSENQELCVSLSIYIHTLFYSLHKSILFVWFSPNLFLILKFVDDIWFVNFATKHLFCKFLYHSIDASSLVSNKNQHRANFAQDFDITGIDVVFSGH